MHTQGSSCLATAGLSDFNPFGIPGMRRAKWSFVRKGAAESEFGSEEK